MTAATTRPLPFLTAVLLAACSGGPTTAPPPPSTTALRGGAQPWAPPPTRTVDVVDDYHGEKIADPYRWLENQDGADVKEWVGAQNRVTRAFLDAVPERAAIRERLRALWNFPRYSVPQRAGNQWLYSKNDGLQNQSVWYITADPATDGKVLLDPNKLSADGTVALANTVADEQGRQLAFATSARGSDWMEWHVLDLATGVQSDDKLEWSKFAGAAWTHDGKGFFYQRYPAPKEGQVYQAQNRIPQLCYHMVGKAQNEDRIVYERPDQPDWGFAPAVSEDGHFLVIGLSAGTDTRNRIAYVDLQQEPWTVQPLLMELDARHDFLGNDGDSFYFRTDKDSPKDRIVAVLRQQPAPANWRTVVPEGKDALRSALLVRDTIVCRYLSDAADRLLLYGTDGKAAGEIALPGLGTVGQLSGRRNHDDVFLQFVTFLQPPTTWHYDVQKKELKVFRQPKLDFDPAPFTVERVFPQSHDGTRLCLFLVHRKGLQLDGSHPTYLYGYGGFDIALSPTFNVPNLVWVERGGIFAMAILRGGGEYGQDWHKGGMLGNKQNVFDDFVACAEYLQRNGYTSSKKLAIGGASNGGLLVGASLTQHPELFGAAIPEVGVHDMLRYQRFTIGWAWAPEYGSADDATQFQWLRRYSPLHNIQAGRDYPPTMVMTGDHDDRVLPGHSFKFGATLQQQQGGSAPILLRIETDAGHGAGKPVQKQIDEAADRWAFLSRALAD